MAIGPQSGTRGSGLRLERGQPAVGRVPPEPPRVAGADELSAEAPAVGHADLSDDSPVAVALVALDGHDLAEGQPREVLLRTGRRRLAALGGVDPAEPDDRGSAARRMVSVSPSVMPMTRAVNVSADTEQASRSRTTAKAHGCQARARRARVFRTPRYPYPPGALGGWVAFRYSSRSAAVPSLPWITWTRTERTWPSTGARTSVAGALPRQPLERSLRLCHGLPGREEIGLRLGEASGSGQLRCDELAPVRWRPRAALGSLPLPQFRRRLLALPLELWVLPGEPRQQLPPLDAVPFPDSSSRPGSVRWAMNSSVTSSNSDAWRICASSVDGAGVVSGPDRLDQHLPLEDKYAAELGRLEVARPREPELERLEARLQHLVGLGSGLSVTASGVRTTPWKYVSPSGGTSRRSSRSRRWLSVTGRVSTVTGRPG